MNTPRPHLIGLLAGLFLAAGLVVAAAVVTRAWLNIAESQIVSVTGSARKDVASDLIVWRGQFSVETNSLPAAQIQLKAASEKVAAFLWTHSATNFSLSPISIEEVRSMVKQNGEVSHHTITGYRLTQSVEVRSTAPAHAEELSRHSTVLVENGVLFTTGAPVYIYTKAGEAKVEMLAEATRDARTRAEQIASQGGRRLSQLRSARMGVFQITPIHSIQTAWDGMNDTTSLEKTITAVVSATFSLK